MHRATLPFSSTARATAATIFPPALVLAPDPLPVTASGLRRYRGVLLSALLHGIAIVLVWRLAAPHAAAPVISSVVELIRIVPPRVLAPPPPPPPPKPLEPQAKPVSLAPPRPVSAAVPQAKTVDAPAASAETTPAPAAPALAAPIGPVTPAPVAPVPASVAARPTPPASRVVSTEGIPTDYVNQVYARINRNTDYPQQARQRRQQGKVGYVLTLDPQGALLKVDIQGSGVEALDDAARQAIQRAAPFPALPDLGGSTYLLAGNIVFKLN